MVHHASGKDSVVLGNSQRAPHAGRRTVAPQKHLRASQSPGRDLRGSGSVFLGSKRPSPFRGGGFISLIGSFLFGGNLEMYKRSLEVVFGNAFLQSVLNAYGAAPGAALAPLPSIGLWQDPTFNPSPSNVLADFAAVEANFTGYIRQTPVFSGVVNIASGVQGLVASVTFEADPGSPFVPNSIYGYFWTSTPGIVMFERFQNGEPAPIGIPGDFLTLELIVPAPPRQSTEAQN